MRYGLSYFRINRHGKPSSCPPCAQVCAPGRAYFDIYSNRRNVVYLRYQGSISTPTTIRKNVQFKFRSRKLFHSFLLPRPKMFVRHVANALNRPSSPAISVDHWKCGSAGCPSGGIRKICRPCKLTTYSRHTHLHKLFPKQRKWPESRTCPLLSS